MTGKSPFYQYITRHYFRKFHHLPQLLFHGSRPAPSKNALKTVVKFVAVPAPVPFIPFSVKIHEPDRIIFFVYEKIFRAEPHDYICTLLKIGFTSADINHSKLSRLILLLLAIK